MQRSNVRFSGFSLIELIVAVGIFSITATFAMGTLLTLTNAQRKAAALQSAFDNVRFAIEAMAKDMRTGTTYQCVGTGYPCAGFSYINSNGDAIVYDLSGNQLRKQINSGTPQAVTDKSVYINQLSFYLNGSATNDAVQPTVTVVVSGTAGRSRANIASTIQLQTTVAPRKLQP